MVFRKKREESNKIGLVEPIESLYGPISDLGVWNDANDTYSTDIVATVYSSHHANKKTAHLSRRTSRALVIASSAADAAF